MAQQIWDIADTDICEVASEGTDGTYYHMKKDDK